MPSEPTRYNHNKGVESNVQPIVLGIVDVSGSNPDYSIGVVMY